MSQSDQSPDFHPGMGDAASKDAAVVSSSADLERHLESGRPRRRMVRLPAILFAATAVATFWAGGDGFFGPSIEPFEPDAMRAAEEILATPQVIGGVLFDRVLVAVKWSDGLIYMLAVMAILGTHELGHFVQAMRYRIPASLPFFIPMPISPIGTMGAVIGMHSLQANRRQLFDIGLTGPIAGLIVALPIAWIGIQSANVFDYVPNPGDKTIILRFQDPLAFKLLMAGLRPDILPNQVIEMNPLLRAGWVGLLLTGLNMLPVSQLDGGHVAYALFGRKAHWLARGVLFAAMAYVALNIREAYPWILMIVLVILMRPEHPPTRDDFVPLGWGRTILGLVSLALPVLCLTPNPISVTGP